MSTDTAAASLRHTDRKRLLGHLLKLSDADPGRRAQAALNASELLRRKGLGWEALVPADRSEDATVSLPHDWQRRALAMSVHPGATPDERNFLNKLAGWKAPGQGGMARMQAIAERIGVELN